MKGAEDQRQLNNVYRTRRQLSVEHSSRMSVEHSSRMSVEYSSRVSVEYSSRMSVEHSSRLPVGDSSVRSVEHHSVMSVGDSSKMSVTAYPPDRTSTRLHIHLTAHHWLRIHPTHSPDCTSTRLHIHPTTHPPDCTYTRLHISPLVPLHIHWRRFDEELDPVSSCNTSMVQKSLRVWKHPTCTANSSILKLCAQSKCSNRSKTDRMRTKPS